MKNISAVKRYISDGFVNFVSGIGVAGRDKSASNHYGQPVYDYLQQETMYRTSWSGRKVIDIPAGDMTRQWRTWAENDVENAKIERKFKLQELSKQAIIMSKKHGGAAIYIGLNGISDEELSEPLNVKDLKPEDLKYLTLFSREEVVPAKYDMKALSERYGRGELFNIKRGEGGESLKIHHSRFAWFGGAPTSAETARLNQGWDDSVYTSLRTLIETADSALADLAALLPEARVDVLKINDLASYFEDEESESRLQKRILGTQYLKSITQSLVIDAQEDYENKTTQFAGVVDVFSTALETLAGAAEIPITRFLMKSPGGLNSTGESDLINYYDSIKSRQENELSTALSVIDDILFPDAAFKWSALWQLSPDEQAKVNKANAETTQIYVDSQLFDNDVLAQASLKQLEQNNVYPGLAEIIEGLGGTENAIDVVKIPEDDGNKSKTVDPVTGSTGSDV